jgi:alpha-tubulin suppressor-like RCC1 family protein
VPGPSRADAARPHKPRPLGLPQRATKLVVGHSHGCALTERSEIYCWGQGALGQRASASSREPGWLDATQAMLGPARDVDAEADATCAVLSDGHIACWGECPWLGPDQAASRTFPRLVPEIDGAISVAVGRDRMCALLADGSVVCLDASAERQASASGLRAARGVQGVERASMIVAGDELACAIESGSRILCWGPKASILRSAALPGEILARRMW